MGENIEKYTTQVRFSHNILYVNIKSAPLKMEHEISTRNY